MVDIRSCEEIAYNIKKDSFSVVVWAIGKTEGSIRDYCFQDDGIVEGGQSVE